LDAWRAVLIGAVMLFHYMVRYVPPDRIPGLFHFDHVYPHVLNLGAYGVEVFFVISGLVITMTVLKSHDVADFAFRRFSRLFPAAAVATTIMFLLQLVTGPFHSGIKDLILSYFFVSPEFGANFVSGSYWSLLVELKFYFFVALAYLLLRTKFWIAMAAVPIVQLILRDHWRIADVLIAPYWPFFLVGTAAWYGIFEKRAAPAAALIAGALLGLPFLPHVFSPFSRFDPDSPAKSAAIVFVAIAALVATTALRSKRHLGPLSYLGRISYSIYLIHEVVGVTTIYLLKRQGWCPDWLAITLAASISIGLGAVLFHSVELPAQQWLRRLYHARRPHLLPTTAQA
jgi:peptidoglycan/LPS O-acetylase OafA/YrhL